MNTFRAVINEFDSNLWSHYFAVPKEISAHFIKHHSTRVICTLNHTYTWYCALMPDGEKGFFININKEVRNKLKLELGSEVNVVLKPDESKYGTYLPPEFEELLEQDKLGAKYFELLTPGKKRSLLHIVSKFKSSEKRIEKGIIILNYLCRTEGKLDFRELNEAFRNGL